MQAQLGWGCGHCWALVTAGLWSLASAAGRSGLGLGSFLGHSWVSAGSVLGLSWVSAGALVTAGAVVIPGSVLGHSWVILVEVPEQGRSCQRV